MKENNKNENRIVVHRIVNKKLVPIRWICQRCNNSYQTEERLNKHLPCDYTPPKKTTRKGRSAHLLSTWESALLRPWNIYLEEGEHMPVQAIEKNGQRYYRWGDSGKLYKTKAEAEKQGRAIYAAGYKGKK